MSKCQTKLMIGLLLTCAACGDSFAADKYWSGTGTWQTGGAGQWSATSGSGYGTSTWQDGDNAVFEGTPGMVTVSGIVSVSNVTFTAAGGYTVSGGRLNFEVGAVISNSIANVDHTFSCGIGGTPDVAIEDGTTQDKGFTFAPAAGNTQALGTCTMPFDNGTGDKCGLTLGGTTTGNSVILLQYTGGQRWGKAWKKGSGSWALGTANLGYFDIEDGVLTVTNTINMDTGSQLYLKGGELRYNTASAVSGSKGWVITGGSLDNTTGSAITSSSNPVLTLGGSLTFIGSLGASSDLNLGTGAVTLSGNRTVTVSNALATLTIEGVIDDGANLYDLTKSGAGTLRLTQNNTYDGATTVAEGTLSVTQPYLDDDAFLNISNGAALNLDYTGTDDVFFLVIGGSNMAAGTWGRVGHPTAAYTTNVITGDGVINNQGGLAPAGTWYWDGPNVGGMGDGAADGGDGTWSIANANWDGGVTARSAWNDTTNDLAIFRTVNGVVALGSDVTIGSMLVDQITAYTFGSADEADTMHFGGSNRVDIEWVDVTFRCGITGSPYIDYDGRSAGHTGFLSMKPTASVTQHIGTIDGANQGQNVNLYLEGDSTGNTVADIDYKVGGSYMFIAKRGTGSWTVTNITYTGGGDIDIEAGTLILNGTCSTPQAFEVKSGGTLKGTGIIDDPLTVDVGGTVTPGDPAGTLTVTNNDCTINGTFGIEVDGASHGALSVQNTLTISNATLNVNVGSSPGSDIVIATCGTLVGEFAATNGLDSWEIEYDVPGGKITLLPPAGGTVLIIR